MNEPKISIIVPVLNGEKYLHECMDSIVGQTLRDIEIICVNDGSTDSTRRIFEEYAAADSRIKIVNQQNHGLGFSRNRGVAEASGEYIAFLDGDDFLALEALEKVYAKAKSADADVVIYGTDRYLSEESLFVTKPHYLKSHLFPSKEWFSPDEIKYNMFESTVGWAWNKIYRRSFMLDNELHNDDHAKMHEDTVFAWMSILLARRLGLVDEVLVHYRAHSQEMISNAETAWLTYHAPLLNLEQQMISHGLFERYRLAYLNFAAGQLLYGYRSNPIGTFKCRMHQLLHDSWLDDLGITQLSHDEFDRARLYDLVVSIIETPPDEFLLREYARAVERTSMLEARVHALNKDVELVEAKIIEGNDELSAIVKSPTYRIGASASRLVRKQRDFRVGKSGGASR